MTVRLLVLGPIVVVVALGGWLLSLHPSAPLRAAIVDQLSSSYPDPAFIDGTSALLRQAGYAVEYVPPERVTVPLYQQLFGPSGPDYDLMILRVHTPHILSARSGAVAFLTNEAYSPNSYVEDQIAQRVAIGTPEQPPVNLFVVTDRFVRSASTRRFHGATVVLMGCSTLRDGSLAGAFMARGARDVIGWDDDVGEAFTDKATTGLLRHMVTEHLSTRTAVARTNAELGPDPVYGGKLAALSARG